MKSNTANNSNELNDVYGTLAALKVELDRIPDKHVGDAEMDDVGVLMAYWTYSAELVTDILENALENGHVIPPGKLPVILSVVNSAHSAMIHEINRVAATKPSN